MSNVPTCPDCGKIMNETSAYWFSCASCGHQCDGVEVEWQNIDPTVERKPSCPDCDGSMKETPDWWFTCNECGKGYDGEMVEWKNGKPFTRGIVKIG